MTVTPGLAVIDKPAGWSSHQVVGRVRRIVGTRRVGHAGTLDPMATGVLVVGVDRATRLLGHLALTDKSYTATIRLGATTVSDDADGEVLTSAGASEVSEDAIRAALPGFTGAIQQVPSAVSAIKVDGVRSYARVRSGQDVQLAARSVRVDRFALTNAARVSVDGVTMTDCEVEVDCSTGTYVRALARDLGEHLACGGHLTALRRTRVGPFTLAEAQTADGPALTMITMPEVARRCFATYGVTPDQAIAIGFGRRLTGLALPADPTAMITADGSFLALYRSEDGDAVPVAVFS